MSLKCVIIEKNANLSETKMKDVKIEDFYKKCGFKSSKDFFCQASWLIDEDKNKIYLYGKKTGRANSENKYDLPPPVDSDLFFGNMLLIMESQEENKYVDLTLEKWNKIYEKLFGGFEDLGSEDEEEEDELADVPDEMKTKQGYLKDDFVVDDEEEIDDDDDEDFDEDDLDILDMESELSEECYIYSDDDDEN
jgi:hypothetical protein